MNQKFIQDEYYILQLRFSNIVFSIDLNFEIADIIQIMANSFMNRYNNNRSIYMEQITKLVYNLSKEGHIADERAIEKCFEYFCDKYMLDKYLENVVISNFKINSLAYYSPDTKNNIY